MKRLKPKHQTTRATFLVTTQQPTSDYTIDKLLFRYIKQVYPIEKVKYNGKFRRCVYLNDKYKPINDVKKQLISVIINNLSNTFDITQIKCTQIVNRYFKS